jgi:hypothetical protein
MGNDTAKTALIIIAIAVAVFVGGFKLIGSGVKFMVDKKILTGQANP